MTKKNKARPIDQIMLFVCSEGETCSQIVTFMRGWAHGCPAAATEIISIANQPEQVVRLGITQTPALVIDGQLIAQNLSVETLAELLRMRWPGTEARSQSSG
jgi:hypothetical protein